MTPQPNIPNLLRQWAWALTLAGCSLAWAGPGAHGPNGEHLDPAPSSQPSGQAVPRLEAQSDLFEAVARLEGGELSLLIDRFDTNEPVLNAQVEVASGPLKAQAKFHGDHGDYAVDDPALLKRLHSAGEHPLVITVVAGQDSDLLDGVLRVGSPEAQHLGHAHDDGLLGWRHWSLKKRVALGLGVLTALAVLGLALRPRMYRTPALHREGDTV